MEYPDLWYFTGRAKIAVGNDEYKKEAARRCRNLHRQKTDEMLFILLRTITISEKSIILTTTIGI